MNHAKTPGAALPCVVQLGFSGSRRLWDDAGCTAAQIAQREEAVVQHLTRRLAEIKLPDNHFLVGISQIACGADTLFSRACAAQAAPIRQRIFLPQHRADFLGAVDSDNKPDFSTAERAEAESILDSECVIQELVVSHAASRSARFEEANVAILRVSDIVVCLLRKDAVGRPGGTQSFLEQAKKRRTPALEIRVSLKDGQPQFEECWHPPEADQQFLRDPPSLPRELDGIPFPPFPAFPSVKEFCDAVKTRASAAAEGHQKRFHSAAAWIIGTHISATVLASVALALHHFHDNPYIETTIMGLLAFEIVFLARGFLWHRYLHHRHAAQLWALSRVVAELGRSVQAIGSRHVYLEHLFRLQLPKRFRFLLRTLNVIHLRSTRPAREAPWQAQRDLYLQTRFDSQRDGQIPYYQGQLAKDERRLWWCQRIFAVCSIGAMICTLAKLGLVAIDLFEQPHWLEHWNAIAPPILGTLAIVLPVLAVGGLSWAAALDCAARVETFRDTLQFLLRQRLYIENASSGEEFDDLLRETELTLLSETAGWYARRSNTSVA
jgi:hypothetical protein